MDELLGKKSSTELKNISRQLNISPVGTKETIIKRIIKSLETASGKKKAEEVLPKELLMYYRALTLQGVSLMTPETEPDPSCICVAEKGSTVCCSQCGKSQHIKCISGNFDILPYVCPLCLLEKISPLDQIVEVLSPPWQLRQLPMNQNSKQFNTIEKTFEYSISTKDLIHKSHGKYQVQLRCLKLDGKSHFMTWPQTGYLIINSKIAMKFETSSNPNARKRKDEPLNITTILNPGKNSIEVIQLNDSNLYALSVFLIYKKTENEYIEEIKKNRLSFFQTKEFIHKVMAFEDHEVQSDSIKFSLKCPITLTLIEIPVRGKNCKHVQCFSLKPFVNIQKTSKVNRWKCPICMNFAYDIVVDEFILQILDKAKCNLDPCFVEIFRDLMYEIIKSEKIEDVIPKKRRIEHREEPVVKIPKIEKIPQIIELD